MITQSNHIEEESVLIAECIAGNRKAQESLYKKFAAKMYAICIRYAGNADDAKDVLQDGFLKVFRYLKTYRGEGSFEGWIRRIIIFTCVNQLRLKSKLTNEKIEDVAIEDTHLTGYDKIAMQDLMNMIGRLSDGYRTVLNLYLVEGYTHKEIGDMLGISEGTSKSQLARAKSILQKQIEISNKN